MDNSTFSSPRRMFAYALRPYFFPLFVMMILIIVANAASYSVPFFLKRIADIATTKSGTSTFNDFLPSLIGTIAVLLLAEVAFRVAHICEWYAVPRVFGKITAELFGWVLEQPTAYFEEHLSGELGRRVEQVGTNISYFIESFPWEVGWAVLALAATGILLCSAHTLLAATFFIWLMLFAITSYPILAWQDQLSGRVADTRAHLGGATVDSFGNAAIVHTFGAYVHEKSIYGGVLNSVVDAENRARFASIISKLHQGMSVAFLGSTLTLVSIYLFTKNAITVGDFVLVAAAVPTCTGVIWTFGDTIMRSIRNFGELRNAVNGLRSTVEPIHIGTKSLALTTADISFDHVSFTYPSSSLGTLHDITLHINAGEKVGIVGRSGAGKSTFVKLLLRQYDPTNGMIRIGGEDIKDTTLHSLRSNITFVPQDTSLFQRTLYENILYAKPEASEQEVFAASEHAHAADFIAQYPLGYETKVGERGVKLSGGQRQRIALARAMLKNAPILILDEATSSLDSESEGIVQRGLEELFRHKTVIAIAHRLSTLKAMDRIVVLENGRIVEDGTPAELLAREGSTFKTLWEHQKSGFVE